MSETPKRPYEQVKTVADAVADMLRPYCDRLELAGSLRRKKLWVGDIEIVAIPKIRTEATTDLFGEVVSTSKVSQVDELLARVPVTLHKNGGKYKAFSIEWQPGYMFKVDLFLPDRDTWGYTYLVRTGSADFSKRFVTARAYGGCKPDEFTISEARVWRNGAAISLPEEIDLFHAFDLEWIEPENRI